MADLFNVVDNLNACATGNALQHVQQRYTLYGYTYGADYNFIG